MDEITLYIMRNIVVVDIDGTLSVVGERRKYIAGEPKDWARFYADKFDDDPIPEVCDLVRELAKTYSILFCTSRSECARQRTQLWLHRHLGMSPQDYTLIMRAPADERPDVVSKIDTFMAETTPEERNAVSFVLDDSEAMAVAWETAGYTCLHVVVGDR